MLRRQREECRNWPNDVWRRWIRLLIRRHFWQLETCLEELTGMVHGPFAELMHAHDAFNGLERWSRSHKKLLSDRKRGYKGLVDLKELLQVAMRISQDSKSVYNHVHGLRHDLPQDHPIQQHLALLEDLLENGAERLDGPPPHFPVVESLS